MKLNEAVKTRIIQLCDERKITINKLGTISGISRTTIGNIIGTRNSSPTVSTIKKLCDGLGIDIIEFFTDDIFRSLEQE